MIYMNTNRIIVTHDDA